MIPKGRFAFMSSVHPWKGDISLYLIVIDPPKTNAFQSDIEWRLHLMMNHQVSSVCGKIYQDNLYCILFDQRYGPCGLYQEATHISMIYFFYNDWRINYDQNKCYYSTRIKRNLHERKTLTWKHMIMKYKRKNLANLILLIMMG
jgi:hypothetical protein